MNHSIEKHWMLRARFLTQLLILSGTLNIGFLGAFLYGVWKENFASISYEVPADNRRVLTNEQVLRAYSRASFQDLLIRLESKEMVEDGYLKRDLALASLVAFHHFHIEKALGGILLQKRLIAFHSDIDGELVDLIAFAALKEEHFEAILHFAKTEKWPITTKGIFAKVLSQRPLYDPSLLEAFYCTKEFRGLYSLMQKKLPGLQSFQLLSLLTDGSWEQLEGFSTKLRVLQCYTEETYLAFLTSYALESRSKAAADLLLEYEPEYVLKRFNDAGLISFLDVFANNNEKLSPFAKKLLVSQRSDELRKKAASILYAAEEAPFPESYDYLETLHHFFADRVPKPEAAPTVKVIEIREQPRAPMVKKVMHKVQSGESLWKIARKYKVSINSIVQLNHLESDRLRIGKELQIPEEELR